MDNASTSSLGTGPSANADGADAFFAETLRECGVTMEQYRQAERDTREAQERLDAILSDILAFANGWGKNAATSTPWEAAARAERLPKEFIDPSQMIVVKVLRKCEYSDTPGELIAVVPVIAAYIIDCKLGELATDKEIAEANARASEQADIQAKGPEHGTSNARNPHPPTDGHSLRQARLVHCAAEGVRGSPDRERQGG